MAQGRDTFCLSHLYRALSQFLKLLQKYGGKSKEKAFSG